MTFLRPSELGDPQSINKELRRLGFQEKRFNRLIIDGKKQSRWFPTKLGQPYCREVEYNVISHKDGKPTKHRGYTLRWDEDVFKKVGKR